MRPKKSYEMQKKYIKCKQIINIWDAKLIYEMQDNIWASKQICDAKIYMRCKKNIKDAKRIYKMPKILHRYRWTLIHTDIDY